MLGKIGKYTAATLEYGTLKTASLLQKGVNIVSGTVTGTAFRSNRQPDDEHNGHNRHKLSETLKIVPRLTVEAGKYTYAVIEYAGQKIYVFLKKGGLSTGIDGSKSTGLESSLANIGESLGNFFRGIANLRLPIGNNIVTVDPQLSERVSHIEAMLTSARLEDRLDGIEAILRNIEQNGIATTGSPYKDIDKPEVKDDAKMLLASILQTNLDLRS
jgi:hypothetical protein